MIYRVSCEKFSNVISLSLTAEMMGGYLRSHTPAVHGKAFTLLTYDTSHALHKPLQPSHLKPNCWYSLMAAPSTNVSAQPQGTLGELKNPPLIEWRNIF